MQSIQRYLKGHPEYIVSVAVLLLATALRPAKLQAQVSPGVVAAADLTRMLPHNIKQYFDVKDPHDYQQKGTSQTRRGLDW